MMFYTILAVLFTLYMLVVSFYLILENRKPQSTYAWLLAFFVAPVLGFLVYWHRPSCKVPNSV